MERNRRITSLVVVVAMASALLTVVAAAPANATVPTTVVVGAGDVSPANPNGSWALEPGAGTGTYSFVSGPATPPGGTGSLALGIATGQHESFFNYSYGACPTTPPACSTPVPSNATPISSFTALGYSAYRASGTSYPTFNIEVNSSGTSGFTSFVFIPNSGQIVNNTWQAWDGMNPAQGVWYSSHNLGTAGGGLFNCPGFGCSASWSQIVSAFPAAVVVTGLGPNVGTDTDFAGNVDNVTVGVSGATTIFDMEPDCTTVCFVNAATGNDFATGLASDPLKTVQEGIDKVQPGGTVNVAAGTYTEQDVVNKAVTITGAGQGTTTIQGPANLADSACVPPTSGQPTRPVVTICGSAGSTVVISGVTISGGVNGEDADASCSPLIAGVYVSDGETLNISQSTVTNVYNAAGPTFWGCQQGVGIRAGSNALGLVGHLIADHVTVLKYQKTGIVVDGPGSSATITNSSVRGDQLATLSQFIAMNGIQISRGASGVVDSNAVSGNVCTDLAASPPCGPDPVNDTQSVGILLFGNPESSAPTISVTNNSVTGNDVGIYTTQRAGTPTISGNTVTGNDEGVFLDEGSALVTGNQIDNNGVAPFGVGVFAVQGTQSFGDTTATITLNTITGNPRGVEAVDICPGVGCPALGGTDAFTTHLTVNRNDLHANSVHSIDNQAPSTVNGLCNWWGQASGPISTQHAGLVNVEPWLLASSPLSSAPCGTGTAPPPPPLPPPPPPAVGHFFCFSAAAVASTAPGFTVPAGVQLINQFSPNGFAPTIGSVDLHCNPVQKTVHGTVSKVVNPRAHLLCMNASGPAQPSFTVSVTNQFGKATLKTGAATQLCLPSWKGATAPPNNATPAPPNLSHFTCYSVAYAPGAAPFKTPSGVSLKDEFSTRSVPVKVGKPSLLCLPTTKLANGVTYTMTNSVTHLLCFSVSATPLKSSVYDQNQFGTGKVHIVKTKLLCLPSTKTVIGSA